MLAQRFGLMKISRDGKKMLWEVFKEVVTMMGIGALVALALFLLVFGW